MRAIWRPRTGIVVKREIFRNLLSAKILPRPKLEAQTTTLALKGVDGFAPLGAVIVTPDEAGDPSALEIVCRVNGEERQAVICGYSGYSRVTSYAQANGSYLPSACLRSAPPPQSVPGPTGASAN